MSENVAITYLKLNETDHLEREALAKEIYQVLKNNYGIEAGLVNLADRTADNEFNGKVISVGGDGVLMGSTHAFTNPENDFVLVQAEGQSAAFYAQTDFRRYKQDLDNIMNNKYDILKATRIKVIGNDIKSPNLINEVAFKEKDIGRTFKYELEIKGKNIHEKFKGNCSTVIFATPCGSTAWNASAVGPVIYQKELDQIAITPESPQSAVKVDPYNDQNIERDRWNLLVPSIFPLSADITFRPTIDAVLIKDGRYWTNDILPAGSEVKIVRGDPLNLICLGKGYSRAKRE